MIQLCLCLSMLQRQLLRLVLQLVRMEGIVPVVFATVPVGIGDPTVRTLMEVCTYMQAWYANYNYSASHWAYVLPRAQVLYYASYISMHTKVWQH